MPPSGENLSTLAELVGGRLEGDGDVECSDVTHDSRQVAGGTVFVAVRGESHDGHDFVDDAVARGACAVVTERPVPVNVPYLVVADTRIALAPLAAAIHGYPSERLTLVGITGTNGKTTVTYLLESIAQAAGQRPGVIGTVETRVAGEPVPALRTTPEASDFQRLLRTMVDRRVDLVAAEISSHALALHRVDSSVFAVAGFTNLSQDHLDFHGDMESYFEAKARLFTPELSQRAVISTDDPWGVRLASRATIPLLTVGTTGSEDVTARTRSRDLRSTVIELTLPDGDAVDISVPIAGRFGVANALVAAGCAWASGVDPAAIVSGIERCPQVPGRFEVVAPEPVVVVDYAHTPAGIEGVISSARDLVEGRVIAVIGAGGDRDRSKRPAMGSAGATADMLFVTSDNPRSEDPDAIIDDVISGIATDIPVFRVTNRREAISGAITQAESGDIILILGKGHETGQESGGTVLPFDDRVVAAEELARRGGTR